MTPGMQIEVKTKAGELKIRHVDTFTREYTWDGQTKRFTHQPRKKRWLGSLGMYRPTGDRSMHAVLEEGQQHFESVGEAHSWIEKQKRHMDYAWNSDGLLVGWDEQKRPGDGYIALSVEVWQLYIRGVKARLKAGGSTNQLRVSHHALP